MAWEQIKKLHGAGKGPTKADQWYSVPCVGVGKTTLSFNPKFRESFTNGTFRGVYIFIDRERRCLGFKIASSEQIENDTGWYTVSTSKKGNAGSPHATFYTGTTKKFASAFPDCVGHQYRAHLNPEERIIEVELTPANMAR